MQSVSVISTLHEHYQLKNVAVFENVSLTVLQHKMISLKQ